MRATETKSSNISWSASVVVADIEAHGTRIAIEANGVEREEIARLAGLRDLPKLAAEFELTPIAGGAVRVVGTVAAVVGQSCVVTLDRVENAISEPVNLVFAPPDTIAESPDDGVDGDASAEPPEPIVNGRIDLAGLAVEFLILGVDPYPRKPDAVFEPVHTPPATEDHPFAGLAALKEAEKPSEPAKPPRKRS